MLVRKMEILVRVEEGGKAVKTSRKKERRLLMDGTLSM